MAAKRLVTLISTLALFLGAGWAAAHAERPALQFGLARPPAPKPYVEGEMLVKFNDDVTPEQIAALNAVTGCKVADMVSGLGIYRLRLPEGAEVPEMVARYQASGLVAFAEPNHRVSIPALPGPKPGRAQPRVGPVEALPVVQGGNGEVTP
ncbi:hypothetical protein D3C87_785260 [compost metagenome]